MLRCDQCRFFYAYPASDRPDAVTFAGDVVRGGGECRRHPPVKHGREEMATYPIVHCDGWCGEFEVSARGEH